MVPESPTA
jgi:hypothetical protein